MLVEQLHNEHKQRQLRIARAAADAQHKPDVVIEPPRPPAKIILPPIPNEAMAAACDLVFPDRSSTSHIIRRAVLVEFPDVSMNELQSDRRMGHVVRARQVAMYLTHKLTGLSFPAIGRRFRRDHTTVLHGVRKITALVKTDPLLAKQVARIEQSISKDGGRDAGAI